MYTQNIHKNNELINLPINYLENLDYVDLIQLCKINKYYYNLCDDNRMIKDLLALKLDIIFPQNMNIAKILNELYNTIINFINRHYTEFPRWVDKNLFMIDFTKQFYIYTAEQLATFLLDDYDYDNHTINYDVINSGDLPLYFNRDWVAFAFTSNKFEIDVDNIIMNSNKDEYIIISNEMMKYIIYAILHTKKIENYYDIYIN